MPPDSLPAPQSVRADTVALTTADLWGISNLVERFYKHATSVSALSLRSQ